MKYNLGHLQRLIFIAKNFLSRLNFIVLSYIPNKTSQQV